MYHLVFKKFPQVIFLALFCILSGCKSIKPTIIEKVIYKDSITTKDSIIFIPIEKYVDVVPMYDTLFLSTSFAESKSWVDTSQNKLVGNIIQKGIEQHFKENEKIIKMDSIVEIEKKVPYKVIETKNNYPLRHVILLLALVFGISFLYFIGIKK